MILHYLKIAIRNLRTNKVFTLINVFGLSLGLAAALLIFIWVQNEWTFDGYHKNSDQIYRMICHWQGEGMAKQFCLPGRNAMVDLRFGRYPGIGDCLFNGWTTKYKSSNKPSGSIAPAGII